MADYYSLLARAVANLPKGSPAPARKAIYDRARKALLKQLRTLGPALSEADIAREEAALEAAVARLEGQFAPAPAAPYTSRAAETLARAPTFSATAKPYAPASPSARPAAPTMGAPARPSIGVQPPARPMPGARPAPAAPPPPPAAPPIVAASHEAADIEGQAPPIDAATGVDRVAYAPAPADHDSIRPVAPSRFDAPRANPLPWILLAVVVGVVISVAVAAFLLRQKPQDLAIKEPAETAQTPSPASAAKIVERVGDGAAATPAPTPTSSAEATPAAETTAATPAPAPTTGATAAATPQPAATSGVPAAARAAMLVAVAADPQKPSVSLGSVVWTLIPPIPGQPGTIAVKAEADIPDLKMHAIMTIRKNTDPSLPATHTIDLRVTFGAGSDVKGIKDVRVPMMRRDDPPAQDSLAGVRVKISDGYFLVGLDRTETDAAHNVDLLATRPWFDFPMLLSDDRIAKLTFEKGADGDRVMAEALAAWKTP